MGRVHQIALNHNNTSGLANLTPQPFVSGVKSMAYLYGGDAGQYTQGGLYVVLEYSSLDGSDFEDLMLQIGLYDGSVESREVTLKTKWTRTIFRKYNGTIHRPIVDVDYKWSVGDMVKDLKITVSDLTLL